MRFQVRVHGVETGFDCARSESVLAAMGQAGARGLTVGCRNGGCGVCRVQVLAGDYETGQMSAAQISADDHARGVVLACQLYPRSDLRLRALGRSGQDGEDATLRLLRSVSRGCEPRQARATVP